VPLAGDSESAYAFRWSAVYDGLGRRCVTRTEWGAWGAGGFTASAERAVVLEESWFDPLVEFLEIVTEVRELGNPAATRRSWRVHGPDANGSYGGLQGLGGLEAVYSHGAAAVASGSWSAVIDDYYGHVIATVEGAAEAQSVVWQRTRSLGYGPAPDSPVWTLSEGASLEQATAWRGRRQDITGFYWMGARYYEGSSGRFLSPDPYGHAASLSLYDYAGGDPINFVDPTGRLQKLQNFASEAGLLGNDIGISMAANDGSMFVEGHLKAWNFSRDVPEARKQMRAQVAQMFVGDENMVQAVSDRFFFETLAPRIAEELEGEKAAALAWNAAMTEYRQSPAAQAQRTVMEVGVGLLNLSGINGVQGKTQEVVLRFNGDTGLIEPTIVTSEISGGAQALEIARPPHTPTPLHVSPQLDLHPSKAIS
jgi:RHS repeat-associated protein